MEGGDAVQFLKIRKICPAIPPFSDRPLLSWRRM